MILKIDRSWSQGITITMRDLLAAFDACFRVSKSPFAGRFTSARESSFCAGTASVAEPAATTPAAEFATRAPRYEAASTCSSNLNYLRKCRYRVVLSVAGSPTLHRRDFGDSAWSTCTKISMAIIGHTTSWMPGVNYSRKGRCGGYASQPTFPPFYQLYVL